MMTYTNLKLSARENALAIIKEHLGDPFSVLNASIAIRNTANLDLDHFESHKYIEIADTLVHLSAGAMRFHPSLEEGTYDEHCERSLSAFAKAIAGGY